jgi:hypothetical protein
MDIADVPNEDSHLFSPEHHSAGLLAELLDEFQDLLIQQGFPVDGAFNDGIGESEVRNRLARINLTPPDELLVWFKWHDGQPLPPIPPLARATSIQSFLSIDHAIDEYLDEPEIGVNDGAWHPDWLLIGTHLAVSCGESTTTAPLIRAVYPDVRTEPHDKFYVRRSLCAPVQYWIENLKAGAHYWDAEAQLWQREISSLAMLPESNGFV